MKRVLIVLFLLMPVLADATVTNLRIFPESPFSGQPVFLIADYVTPDAPGAQTLMRNGSIIELTVVSVIEPGGVSVTPFSFELGSLPTGDYELRATFDLVAGGGVLTETLFFSVRPAVVPTLGFASLLVLLAIVAFVGVLKLRTPSGSAPTALMILLLSTGLPTEADAQTRILFELTPEAARADGAEKRGRIQFTLCKGTRSDALRT